MNKDINKDCWIKSTEYKLCGFKIFEKVETCDSSSFQKSGESCFYSVPKKFREER